jgi:hypothetical protein
MYEATYVAFAVSLTGLANLAVSQPVDVVLGNVT